MKVCINTFAGIRNVIDDARNNNVNFHWKYVQFKGDKIVFKKSYDKTNLTLVVIHMKLIKLADGSFKIFI